MHLLNRLHSRRPNWAVMAAVAIFCLAGCAGTKAPEQAPAPTQAVMSTATATSAITKVSGKDIRLAQGPQAKGEMWVRVLKRWSEADWRADPIAVQRFLDIDVAEMGYPKLVRPGYAWFSVSYMPVKYEAKSLDDLGLGTLDYHHIFETAAADVRNVGLRFQPSHSCVTAHTVLRVFGANPERLPPSIVVPAPALTQNSSVPAPAIPATPQTTPVERGKLLYQLPQRLNMGRIAFSFDGKPCAIEAYLSFNRSISL